MLADRDAAGLGRAVRHELQGGLVVRVDRRLVGGRHQLRERGSRGGRDRRVHRGAGRRVDLSLQRRIAAGDRVDRLEHRHLDERHHAHGRRRCRELRGDVDGPGVGVGDDVGLNAEGAGQCRESQEENGDPMFHMHELDSFIRGLRDV